MKIFSHVRLFFAWYDFWVGIYYDTKKNIIYICPIPMFGVQIKFKRE